jgi:serine protease Do
LKSVLVQSVTPGLPAAVAGVAAGDSVLEVDGKPVSGALAADMAKLMKKSPGETLVLKLGRANREVYTVRLTAVVRP